jgi:thiol-disulfide isomerase/thioredoxin
MPQYKITFQIVAILSLIICCQGSAISQGTKNHSFILKGKLEDRDTGYIYLSYSQLTGYNYDSALLVNGHFTFTGNIPEPTKATLSAVPIQLISGAGDCSDIYIEPGSMQIAVRMNHFNDLKLTGSSSDSERTLLVKLKDPINDDMQPIYKQLSADSKSYMQGLKSGMDSLRLKTLSQKMAPLWRQIQNLQEQEAAIDSSFVINHPGSFVAAEIVSFNIDLKRIAFPSVEDLYRRFPEAVQNSYHGRKIRRGIENEKKVPIGSHAKNFIAIDNRGDTISLGSYKEKKYVLLDFWASGCVPCRQLTPTLNILFKKYNKDLEIISIANENDKDAWLKAITKDGMDWPQIIENDSNRTIEPVKNSISDTYGIYGIPELILIDRNSNIIEKFGGGIAAKPSFQLEQELDHLLKK